MSQPTWIGQKLGGRYVIEAEIGHGGMATVYKATDPNLRRVVAIKLIHPHFSRDLEFVRRFEAEATAVAQLRHPHIIQVYDFNHDNDAYYIVFEFVPGETLQQRLKRLSDSNRRMEIGESLEIATSIGDALVYAHERNIIHRDIKPANILINVQDEAILTDFGIVKIVGGTQHTATGAVMGTARYMSPEQIKGNKVGEISDLYSFGVMLYEMVGGRAPFNADSAMTLMMMHLKDPVPDMRQIRSETPPALVAVINKALAKEPAQRYQTMTQLVSDLRRIQSGSAVSAPLVSGANAGATMLDTDLTDLLESEMPVPVSASAYPATEAIAQPLPSPSLPSPASPTPSRKKDQRLYWGLGAAALLALIAVAFFVFRGNGDDGTGDETPTAVIEAVASATAVSEIVPPENTPTSLPPTDEPTPTDLPPTATLAPTATDAPLPTVTNPPPTATNLPPTATHIPPTAVTQLSTRITGISIDGDRYVVSYETAGFTETLPGTHVHFFFNTVPPEQAGVPGSGNWFLYGGPRPFTGYGVNDRGSATQLCVLVANPDHSVIANSGNCSSLP